MDFEKLGAFYLGKEFDLERGALLDRLVMYDARDLTTHAVCLGMTGSGKTGLCIDLLEEAAIDRVPAIIIDPKGDITNLLLQFPDLRPEDFQPWINPEDARRKGLSVEAFAAQQAQAWKDGLAQWGQDGSRIANLRKAADFAIYTPGSEAAVPVSIVQSFAAPPLSWDTQAEDLRERISATVSGLLGLVGIEADPVRSREHILLSNIFEQAWRKGENLDFEKLILAIQKPPFARLGVFEVDTFFPPSDRFGLAMALNNLIASPSFSVWMKGAPLDIPRFLASSDGRPRHSIFYIAHLSDSERVFFVTLLLNQVISWMRSQPGTTSLRALVYMDEIFGFFPPVANPPSKKPMLTLLKQARAFGVGMVLATQNPVDLDYKGLTNAGTWLIGRLQTDRDKDRVLDGLTSASVAAGTATDRQSLDRLLSRLGNRVFLLHNVHQDNPVVFQTRWAMSYLRGPLTRDQISKLAGKADETDTGPAVSAVPAASPSQPAAVSPALGLSLTSPPSLPPGIRQGFLSLSILESGASRTTGSASPPPPPGGKGTVCYRVGLLAEGSVHFLDQKRGVDEVKSFALFSAAEDPGFDWASAQDVSGILPVDREPVTNAEFAPFPEGLDVEKALKREVGAVTDQVYRTYRLDLLCSEALGVYSRPGEDRRAFSLRLGQYAREARDREVDEMNDRYGQQLDRLMDRLRRAEMALEKKESDASAKRTAMFVSVGESVLGMFLGRRSLRAASSSLTKYRAKTSAQMAVEEAGEKVEDLQRDIEELKAEMQSQADEISRRWDRSQTELKVEQLVPRRGDIRVDRLEVAWEPLRIGG